MTTIQAFDQAELGDILATAQGGETVELVPGGDWSRVEMTGQRFETPVTLVGEAIVGRLRFRDCEGFDVRGISGKYHFTPGDHDAIDPFSITDSRRVTWEGGSFEGDFGAGTFILKGAPVLLEGLAWGRGPQIRRSEQCGFTSIVSRRFRQGVTFSESRGVWLRSSAVLERSNDAVRIVSSRDVAIEGNYLANVAAHPQDTFHHDCVHCFTPLDPHWPANVVITGNLMIGVGEYASGMMLQRDGQTIRLSDWSVEGNTIFTHNTGISTWPGDNLNVRGNTLVRYGAPLDDGPPTTIAMRDDQHGGLPSTGEVSDNVLVGGARLALWNVEEITERGNTVMDSPGDLFEIVDPEDPATWLRDGAPINPLAPAASPPQAEPDFRGSLVEIRNRLAWTNRRLAQDPAEYSSHLTRLTRIEDDLTALADAVTA